MAIAPGYSELAYDEDPGGRRLLLVATGTASGGSGGSGAGGAASAMHSAASVMTKKGSKRPKAALAVYTCIPCGLSHAKKTVSVDVTVAFTFGVRPAASQHLPKRAPPGLPVTPLPGTLCILPPAM